MAASTTLMLRMVTAILCSLQPTAYAVVFHGNRRLVSGMEGNMTNVTEYLGLRYAQPPLNDRRFKYVPLYTYNESDVYAVTPPAACMQDVISGSWISTVGVSEDCLFLNVFVPECQRFRDHLRIMVWIHGGRLESGTASDPLYNGTYLAAKHCIVIVTVNYRLGPFGFMYMGTDDAPGNMAFEDVRVALTWVKENAHHFRSDGNGITLAGNNAGAYIITAMLMANHTWHLYDNAILQSGGPITSQLFQSQTRASQLAQSLANRLNCNRETTAETANCLRDIPSARLQEAYSNVIRESHASMVSVIDFNYLSVDPRQHLLTRALKPCSILTGYNQDEGTEILKYINPTVFNTSVQEPQVLSEEEIDATLRNGFSSYFKEPYVNNMIEAAKLVYDYDGMRSDPNPSLKLLNAMARDQIYACTTAQLVEAYIKMSQNVSLYVFNHPPDRSTLPTWLGATYRSEVPYVFNTSTQPNQPANFTARETDLSVRIQHMWATFGRYGNPSYYGNMGTQFWPFYNLSSPQIMEFTPDAGRMPRPLDTKSCEFWNSVPPEMLRDR